MNKNIVAIHDLACYGKCSLTIVLPILSTCGLSTSVLPTALLSTHTGGYGKPWMHNLEDDMEYILNHWNQQGIQFDAIYSGYVSSIEQLKKIEQCITYNKNRFYAMDPVMGDQGKLYASLPTQLPQAMRILCAKADLVLPNMTEAYALLNEPYHAGPYQKEEIERVCYALSKICKKDIILTSVSFSDKDYGSALYIKDANEIHYEMRERLHAHSHGTGDTFASCVVGAYISGCSLHQAVRIATDFVLLALQTTLDDQHDERRGLRFEQHLSRLYEQIQIHKR